MSTAVMRLQALAVSQPGGTIYLFSVDGKQVPRFACVSRIRRQEGVLQGYQRVEALGHIQTIRDYLEQAKALVPNAVVIGFNDGAGVTFQPLERDSAYGELVIPLAQDPNAELPGFIVDGQQRLAAVRDAAVEAFPLAAVAFIGGQKMQAEQFLRVNSTKPLPKNLLHALLPHTEEMISPALESRRVPAMLVERLCEDADSPLKGMIQTATSPSGIAKDTSFLNALEHSIRDGALYELRDDMEAMVATLKAWWGAVQDVFPRDWGKKPKDSRLFHGAGVAVLHLLMDSAADVLSRRGAASEAPLRQLFAKELGRVKKECCWSSGTWAFRVDWNKLENTSQAKRELAMYLTTLYIERARRSPRGRKQEREDDKAED